MIPSAAITDYQRAEFLEKLHGSDLLVTDWERDFLRTFRGFQKYWMFLTDGRRVSADKMWMKYGGEIGMSFPQEKSTPSKIPEADPNGCQFLVQADDGQQPCNAPAVLQRRNRFRYCQAHADGMRRDMKRRGIVIQLEPFAKGPA